MPGQLVLRELSRYQLGTFADIIYRNAILYPESEALPQKMNASPIAHHLRLSIMISPAASLAYPWHKAALLKSLRSAKAAMFAGLACRIHIASKYHVLMDTGAYDCPICSSKRGDELTGGHDRAPTAS
jgi:hypothetical protein